MRMRAAVLLPEGRGVRSHSGNTFPSVISEEEHQPQPQDLGGAHVEPLSRALSSASFRHATGRPAVAQCPRQSQG